MSIATKRGDSGQTGLPGGIRVSKADCRVETYGTIDELIASLGLARSLCENAEVRDWTKAVQRELFKVGSAIATPPESRRPVSDIEDHMVERLTQKVHEIEGTPGLISDWTIAGEHTAGAAFDVARTVCRRAERLVVGLAETGIEVQPNVLRYLNRLSDVLWLVGRQLEYEAGVDGRLREPGQGGPRWSRAW